MYKKAFNNMVSVLGIFVHIFLIVDKTDLIKAYFYRQQFGVQEKLCKFVATMTKLEDESKI